MAEVSIPQKNQDCNTFKILQLKGGLAPCTEPVGTYQGVTVNRGFRISKW